MAVLRVEKRLKNSYVLYITYMLTHTAINVKAVQSAIICVHSSHQKCNFLRQSAREKHICSTYKRCLQYRSTCCINYANERNVESYVRSLTPDLVVYEFSHHPAEPGPIAQPCVSAIRPLQHGRFRLLFTPAGEPLSARPPLAPSKTPFWRERGSYSARRPTRNTLTKHIG